MNDSSDLEPSRPDASPMPFEGLRAPEPIERAPEPMARWLAFVGVAVGGLLGGLIGFGTGDLLGGSSTWAAFGALVGALVGAVGVGVVASLTLQAMGEWKAVDHPEDQRP